MVATICLLMRFQLTAARRRLGFSALRRNVGQPGFNSQPPGGGWVGQVDCRRRYPVSTHSRPEAAGTTGCSVIRDYDSFQLTAARRRLGDLCCERVSLGRVSTHSRPEAAGYHGVIDRLARAGFNSQPPGGGWPLSIVDIRAVGIVSTHSRPEAAGEQYFSVTMQHQGFNSQPPGGGWQAMADADRAHERVSTHSRPEAAGRSPSKTQCQARCFNSQPPGGGWWPCCQWCWWCSG